MLKLYIYVRMIYIAIQCNTKMHLQEATYSMLWQCPDDAHSLPPCPMPSLVPKVHIPNGFQTVIILNTFKANTPTTLICLQVGVNY